MTNNIRLQPFQQSAVDAIRKMGSRSTVDLLTGRGASFVSSPVNDERIKQMVRDFTLGVKAAVENPEAHNWLTIDSLSELNGDITFASSAPLDYVVPPRRSTMYYHVQSALMGW